MVIIHEIGHVIAIYIIGGRLKRFEYSFYYIRGIFEYPDNLTFNKYFFFTANGVIIQLLVSLLVVFGVQDFRVSSLAFFYLCVIAINLVPLSMTDGAFIFKAYPISKVKKVLWLSVGGLFLFSLFGLVLLWAQYDVELENKIVLTFFYIFMLVMSIRRIFILNTEEDYGT